MSRQYYVVPSDYSPDNVPPEKLRQLHKEGPNEQNAEIVIVENGITVNRMMYRSMLAGKLEANIPPVPDRVHVGGETQTQILGGEEPPEIKKGAPPVYQYIRMICDRGEGEKKEEIVDEVFKRWDFSDVPFIDRGTVEGALVSMQANLIVTPDPDEGTYHPGARRLEYYYDLEDTGFDIKEGEYPTVVLARRMLEREGTMKSYDLLDLIMEWKWAVNREYGRKWVDYSISKKYIKHLGSRVLAPDRALKE